MNKRFIALAITAAVTVSAGAAAAAAGSPASTPGDYNATASTRLLDTRTASGPLGAAKTLVVPLPASVPADATAVTVNLTAVGGTATGYLLAYADGGSRPAVGSNVNYLAGQTVANQATVPVTDGKIDVFNAMTAPSGTVQVIVDLEGWYTPVAPAYTPPATSWSATTNVSDHPDSGNNGTPWAVDTFVRTVTLNLRGAAPVSDCGDNDGAKACYLYDATISDNGTFTTASSKDVATDGKSPNAGAAVNGTVEGTITGGTPVEFYASTDTPSAAGVPASVTGPVGGEQTTDEWVEQFFPAGTLFSAPELLQWAWTYSAPGTCEQWADTWNGESGDITGVNACSGS